MQGITAEVFPAWAVPFALGLSRRADSDTLTAGIIGRVAVCRFAVGKILCDASSARGTDGSQDGLMLPVPGHSALGTGPGEQVLRAPRCTQSRRQILAQWHFACTDAMISDRPVLKSCCDSTDSTGDDLMGLGRSLEHHADCCLMGCSVTLTIQ